MSPPITGAWHGGNKPYDFGTGELAASFGSSGAWLSVGGPHPEQGFVELSGMPLFDESVRGRPDEVRHYRAAMATEESAFLHLTGLAPGAEVTSRVEPIAGGRGLRQLLKISPAGSDLVGALELVFRGRLDRPALAMITEVGSAQRPVAATCELHAVGSTLRVSSRALPATAEVRVEPADAAGWKLSAGSARLRLPRPAAGSALELRIELRLDVPRFGVGHSPGPGPSEAEVETWLSSGRAFLPPELDRPMRAMAAHALDYVRQCTCLRVGPGRVAILTDHRLLPLSWARDAYYQALLLLRHGEQELVADHLRWLWLDCDRPAGSWARSHLANGRRSDDVFQADQQLYPLLELIDYQRNAGDLPELGPGRPVWAELVAQVLDGLIDRLSEGRLLPTDENAADDPAVQPYLLANQVLAGYTFDRLAPLAARLGLVQPLERLAHELREAARAAFLVSGPSGPLWAYSIDGNGAAQLYHDANDLPTAFAPMLGFCSADDRLWRATMDFAFSAANEAYVEGEYGGLGSRHTPGVWPLGLIQEWVARSLMGELAPAERALRRLAACGLSDGSLPEASDPRTARMVARHWFAWPGALLGTLLPD